MTKNLAVMSVLAFIVVGIAFAGGSSDADDIKCGENLTWSCSNNVLTISGYGPMYDYSAGYRPWSSYTVKSVVLSPDITTIGAYAFYNTKITSISIPESVTSLGSYSLSSCSSLNEIVWNASECSVAGGNLSGMLSGSDVTLKIGQDVKAIPENFIQDSTRIVSVEFGEGSYKVGAGAFKGCTNTLFTGDMGSITSFGAGSFENCTKLTSITIGSDTSALDGTAFKGCTAVTQINMCPTYLRVDACPLLEVGTAGTAIQIDVTGGNVPANMFKSFDKDATVTLGMSVKSIGANAFDSSNLTVSMSDAYYITSIGERAFAGATIYQICLPAQLKTIGNSAFEGCQGVSSIYYNCYGVTAPKTGNKIFASITSDELKIEMGTSAAKVPSNLFESIAVQTEVKLSASLKTIEQRALSSQYFTVDMSDCDKLSTIGAYAFAGSKIPTIRITPSVSSIGNCAFSDVGSVTKIVFCPSNMPGLTEGNNIFAGIEGEGVEVVIDKGVRTIPTYLFSSLSVDASTVLPSTVTEIGNHAFYGSGLDVDMSACTGLKTIGEQALAGSRTTAIMVPSTVSSIGKGCFSDIEELSSIRWESVRCGSLQGKSVFTGSGNGCSFIFADSVTEIPAYILEGAVGIADTTLPKTVTAIGEHAFDGSSARTSTEGCTSLSTIGDYAFSYSGICGLFLYPSISSCGPHAFEGSYGITKIHYDSKCIDDMIGNGAMSLGSIMPWKETSVEFGSSITSIQSGLFAGIANVVSVDLSGIVTIGDSAFMNTGIREIRVPMTVTHLGDYSFAGTKQLRSIVFDNEFTTIGEHAFLVAERSPLDITCFRKAVQNDYDWREDHRDPTFDWNHNLGEYRGMMEVIFKIGERFLGYSLANDVIDFFVDHTAMTALESVDMGSFENNNLLLLGICIFLTALLFLFLLMDRSLLVRRVECTLALLGLLLVIYSCIRRVWEYLDDTTMQYALTILLLISVAGPAFAALRQIRRLEKDFGNTETMVRIYTLDWAMFKKHLKDPFLPIVLSGVDHGKRILAILYLIVAIMHVPSALVYDCFLIICHIPSYILSLPLSKIFTARDRVATGETLCPHCNSLFKYPVYICPNENCRAEHRDYYTGKYGFREAQCWCGQRMNIAISNRRWEYRSRCPLCDADLEVRECEPFAIGFAGAPGSGRTTFKYAMMNYARSNHYEDVPMNSPADADVQLLMPTRSTKDVPVPKGLYFYDSETESYTRYDSTNKEFRYFTNLDGAVLMINPEDLKGYRDSHGIYTDAYKNSPEWIITMLCDYSRFGGKTDKDQMITLPVAVVISRCSQIGLGPDVDADLRTIDESSPFNMLKDLDEGLIIDLISEFKNCHIYATDTGCSEYVAEKILNWMGDQCSKTI